MKARNFRNHRNRRIFKQFSAVVFSPIIWLNNLFIYAVLFCFISLSCNSNKDIIPSEMIPLDSFIVVLSDMQQADAYLNLVAGNSKPYNPQKLLNKVLEKHHTTKDHFDKTLKYFISHPEKSDSLFDKVLAHLSTMKIDVNNKNTNQNQKK